MNGSLVLVATPIGNLGDLSPRAVDTLSTADLVCCEDTRRTGGLLSKAGSKATRLRRMDDHTEQRVIGEVLDLLSAGATVAVVTDAGMPAVSDPGQRLVAAVADAGFTISVVPGPSAGLAALAVSGFASRRHVFEGFLPRRGAERTERLEEIAREPRTILLFESPHRLADTLTDLASACGSDRRAMVGREITKLHEEFARGSLADLIDWAGGAVKGEIVVVLEGAGPSAEPTDDELASALDAALAAGASRRDAAGEVAAAYGVSRRRTYDLAVSSRSTFEGDG